MSRIDAAFRDLRNDRRTGLVTYVTAGDPDLERSREILVRLDRAGADVLEVGVPFSDPLADGPVIQRATERAIAAGTTLDRVLRMIADVRSLVGAPIVIFSYANPILRMGIARFVERAKEAGVDGVLTLDVPPEESEGLRAAFSRARIDTIFLLSPTTGIERIRRASALGTGFLYGISRLGVTGARQEVARSARELAARIRAETAMPLALGFGFSRPEHVRAVGEYADAAVVGSALVNVIAEHGQSPALLDEVERYVRWLKG
jgi:tryptophan synthase alpha chain